MLANYVETQNDSKCERFYVKNTQGENKKISKNSHLKTYMQMRMGR